MWSGYCSKPGCLVEEWQEKKEKLTVSSIAAESLICIEKIWLSDGLRSLTGCV